MRFSLGSDDDDPIGPAISDAGGDKYTYCWLVVTSTRSLLIVGGVIINLIRDRIPSSSLS